MYSSASLVAEIAYKVDFLRSFGQTDDHDQHANAITLLADPEAVYHRTFSRICRTRLKGQTYSSRMSRSSDCVLKLTGCEPGNLFVRLQIVHFSI